MTSIYTSAHTFTDAMRARIEQTPDVWRNDANRALDMLDDDADNWQPDTMRHVMQNKALYENKPVGKAVLDIVLEYISTVTQIEWRLAP